MRIKQCAQFSEYLSNTLLFKPHSPMANNRIAVLVALEGHHDGLKPALTSAQQSLSEFKNSWLRRRKP